jgi:exopolyphosphatase/guanosine-5'-triphosphate,3'-diphosphate pyrophosphatase
MAEASPRFGITGDELFEWMSPLYPQEDPRRRTLRLATSLISDTAWSEHPDYRAEEAFQRGLRMPVAGIEHNERVFVATALHARYGGQADAEIKTETRRLISEDDHNAARAIGLALRLGYTLSAGAPEVLPRSHFVLRDQEIVLTVPDDDPLWEGETVLRRLDAVARAFSRKATIRRAEKRISARA